MTNWCLFIVSNFSILAFPVLFFLNNEGKLEKFGTIIFFAILLFFNFILYFVEPFDYSAFSAVMLLNKYLGQGLVIFITLFILLSLAVFSIFVPNWYSKSYIRTFLLIPFLISITTYSAIFSLEMITKYKDYLALKSSYGVGCKRDKTCNEALIDKLSSLSKEEYLKLKNNALEYFRDIEAQKEQEKIKKEAQAKKAEEGKRQAILESLDI